MRLAHFSDLHLTLFPLSAGFALKRLAAVASYTLAGRGRHFAGSGLRIARLLEDVDEQAVDHGLCTGDLTGVSGAAEFAQVAGLFGPRLTQPQRFTVLPGNHDRYTEGARRQRLFERHFGALCGGAAFPLVKPLPGNVTLVAVDSARPTSLLDSSGRVGAAQRERLQAVLTDASLRDRFVVVALHYGLVRAKGHRDSRHHGLRDDLELMALLERRECAVDLVVHGHMHTAYAVRVGRRQVVNAGSATDLHAACGYNLFELDAANFRLRCRRRAWDTAAGRYQPAPDSPLNFEVTTRG